MGTAALGCLAVRSATLIFVKELLSFARPDSRGRLSPRDLRRFQHKVVDQSRLAKESGHGYQRSAGDVINRIDKIFAESNPRIKIIWDLLNPEMQKELKDVRDAIRAELTPEQREKFEQLLKQPHRPDGRRGPRGTNVTNSVPAPQ